MTIPSKAKGDGMSERLLPCPFCGGEATVGSNRNEGTAWVSCGSCQAQSGGFQDFGMAIHLLEASAADEWNRRHPHSSKPGNEPFPTDNTEGGEWIQHDGKGMPVRPETSVQIKARNGYSEDGWNSAETAAFWAEDERDGGWNWKGQGGDIIAYRVVHPTSPSQQGEQQ